MHPKGGAVVRGGHPPSQFAGDITSGRLTVTARIRSRYTFGGARTSGNYDPACYGRFRWNVSTTSQDFRVKIFKEYYEIIVNRGVPGPGVECIMKRSMDFHSLELVVRARHLPEVLVADGVSSLFQRTGHMYTFTTRVQGSSNTLTDPSPTKTCSYQTSRKRGCDCRVF